MDIQQTIRKAAQTVVAGVEIREMNAVSGGDINDAFVVETDKDRLFVKVNTGVPADFFEKEARGLEELRNSGVVHVPEVLAYNREEDQERFLVLSYIESSPGRKSDKMLGEQLASLHNVTKSFYGLSYDNYIGTFKQENGEYVSWVDYFREKRLLTQIRLAQSNGYLDDKQAKHHFLLADKLNSWLPDQPGSSLLHGDLWGGNKMTDKLGRPVLIDPAILYGDRQMDLAMTALFGGFSDTFYEAYETASGEKLDQEIWPLYQLFYVYMHLNKFGTSYLAHAERIVKRFVG
ncbi:fructosamine kinase family protein [Metabacillus arenae]|uniref:Fructosamine kinase family protein n=1 Tax=Metabacillus arenae TaxID=2771434 RepID=A0A926NFQ0_9BACI|nr:fructosamine kinase family protein [Metabacillus arenae]MBD1382634.1 fructosamine kinase family protein [Metabacillus arenae]